MSGERRRFAWHYAVWVPVVWAAGVWLVALTTTGLSSDELTLFVSIPFSLLVLWTSAAMSWEIDVGVMVSVCLWCGPLFVGMVSLLLVFLRVPWRVFGLLWAIHVVALFRILLELLTQTMGAELDFGEMVWVGSIAGVNLGLMSAIAVGTAGVVGYRVLRWVRGW